MFIFPSSTVLSPGPPFSRPSPLLIQGPFLACMLSDNSFDTGSPMAGHYVDYPKRLVGLRTCHPGQPLVTLDSLLGSLLLWTTFSSLTRWNFRTDSMAGLESGYKARLHIDSRVQASFTWVPFCVSNMFLWVTCTKDAIYVVHMEGRNYNSQAKGSHLKPNGRLWKHRERNYLSHVQRIFDLCFSFIVARRRRGCSLTRAWLTIYLDVRKTFPLFLKYHSASTIQSIYRFLRYFGPRRLMPSRRVLVDDDEYQIMHIGRGSFATITRVLHKQSGEMRVMKRIVFDETDLAKSLAEAEVDTLKAVAGSLWFPVLLNHFKDDEEYIITMVCSFLEERLVMQLMQ